MNGLHSDDITRYWSAYVLKLQNQHIHAGVLSIIAPSVNIKANNQD